jgi:hypothetical protein
MAFSTIGAIRIAAIATCVPARRFDTLTDTSEFTQDEVRKVVAMAGVHARRLGRKGGRPSIIQFPYRGGCSSDISVVFGGRSCRNCLAVWKGRGS